MTKISLGAVWAVSVILATPAWSQDVIDLQTIMTKTADGAIFEYREGVDGVDVSVEYDATILTCKSGSDQVLVQLPLSAPEDSDPPDVAFKKNGADYDLAFNVDASKVTKTIHFVAVTAPNTNLQKAGQFTVSTKEPLWTALTHVRDKGIIPDSQNDQDIYGVDRDEKFAEFQKACGIDNAK